MRPTKLLMLCAVGGAVCLVLLALNQSLPVNKLLPGPSLPDDNDADDFSKRIHREQSKDQSLRYASHGDQVPVADKVLLDEKQSRLDASKRISTSPAQPMYAGSHRRHKFARSMSVKAPDWLSTVYYDRNYPPAMFNVWNSSRTEICPSSASSGNTFSESRTGTSQMTAYGNLFAELRNVVIDRENFLSDLKGGENLEDVIGQDESKEYYRVKSGCFQLDCRTSSERPFYDFAGEKHLDEWYSCVQFGNGIGGTLIGSHDKTMATFQGFTLAVVRYEYANLFHAMTDLYNGFALMQFFGKTPGDTNILIVDAHPFGALDSVWTRLFGSVTRLSALRQKTRFQQLVWNIVGYESPMTIYARSPCPPLFEEFRNHVLHSYNIEDHPASQVRNCSALTVQFIWRRDYLAHPRNPSGKVHRKFANERDLVQFVQLQNPGFHVSGVQIDLLDMGDQLRRIVAADIVVGVHGAGLTHAVFMRRNAGLAEINPNVLSASNEHFEAIAGWRGLHYIRWTNHDITKEDETRGTLRVPAYIANTLVTQLAKRICNATGNHVAAESSQSTSPMPRRRQRRISD